MRRVPRTAKRSSSPTNAAVWLALGTAAGVLVGVTLADRSGGRKLLHRLSSALKMFDGLKSQFAGGAARGIPSTDVPFEDDLEEDDLEDNDLDDDDFEEALDEDLADDETVTSESDSYDDGDFDPELDEDDEEYDSGEGWVDERVLAAFEQDPILADRDIEIDEPEPAVITLRGRVGTGKDAKHAVTIARGVPGVARVENYIKVRNQPPVSPPPEDSDA